MVVGDMADDLPAGPFSLVFVAFNTFFGLTSREAQARCFAEVAGRLEPHGVLRGRGLRPRRRARSEEAPGSRCAR